MTLNERWRPIPGYEGAYEVSDHGRVRSLTRVITNNSGVKRRWRGRILSPVANHKGYLQVTLGQTKTVKVHRLVLAAFVGPCPEGYEGCHNDGNPANNKLSNLRWDTRSGNELDKVRHGTHNQTAKTHCPSGHKLASPNLVLAAMKLGKRNCLACGRARNYVYNRPGMKQHFQKVSDSYYDAIIAQQTIDDYLDAA